MRNGVLNALRMRFEAQVEYHKINIENYLTNPVAVAEHPNILESIENELACMAEYQDKLDMLDEFL